MNILTKEHKNNRNSDGNKFRLLAIVKGIFKNLCTKKSVNEFIEEANKSHLKKNLNAFDLIILGIGAVVGTGIFTIVGIAALGGSDGLGAGPAVSISMVIAAFACLFSAFCYCEFASMIPASGSAYTYTYATMGEFAAWMVGWILMLEYAIGNITIACAWTDYFLQFLKGFSHILPSWIINPPIWLINDYRSAIISCEKSGLDPSLEIPRLFDTIPICFNLPAILLILFITYVLAKGIKESTKVAGLMVFIKLTVIFLFIVVGAFYVKPENWVPFAPNGFSGIFMGSFIIFFAYVGFDAISTAAEETKNPQRDLPIGILGTLLFCTTIYVLVAMVLTGMTPLNQIDVHAPIAHAMRVVNQNWVAALISIGALTGLTSVILVYQLGTTRILYSMSRDGFLPKVFQNVHPKFHTPYFITWLTGILTVFGSLFMDLNISAELCNFGTFTSFIIVCIAVLILRKTDPDRPRPFKVPFSPLFPILGIVCCASLMLYSMKFLKISASLFPLWLLFGLLIYSVYSYKHKRSFDFNQKFKD